MSIKINKKDAISLLRKVVSKNPDFVYESKNGYLCLYIDNNKPSCLIGHILIDELNVPKDMFIDKNVVTPYLLMNFNRNKFSAIVPILEQQGITFTKGAIKAFTAAQDAQDANIPWKQCLEYAKQS